MAGAEADAPRRPASRIGLALDEWPPEDRRALEAALRGGNPFDEAGPGAHWRPVTRANYIRAYGFWLAFLDAQGKDLAETAPADRLQPAAVDAYVRHLTERTASTTVAAHVAALHAYAIAAWPAVNWAWLRAPARRLQRQAVPVRNKEALIVRQSELLALGEDLIDATQRMPPPTSRTAAVEQSLLLRDGLIIASLALRPLRCRNFLDLEVGRTLRREQDGWWIDIPAAATKTGVRLRQAFPARLQPALEEFLALHRPRLAGQRAFGPVALRSEPLSPLLWLSRSGAPLSACSLLKLLRRHTRPRFGHAINPHLARDIAATSLADAHPEHMRIAADLLGHKSFATTQRVYIAARQKWALRQVQAEVLRARRLSRRPPSLPTWKPE